MGTKCLRWGSLKIVLLLVTALSVALSGCAQEPSQEPMSYSYSFEEDMQGWISDGTDLDNPPVNWSVERSQELAYEGNSSIMLYLDNMNDAGKIWMEREFDVSPDTLYNVSVSYMFATGDFGDVNLFTIITGVSPVSPEEAGDLAFQEDTGHHLDEQGFVWLEKDYNFDVQSSSNGKLYVSIGVWGTWETPRIYFVDDVEVKFTPVEQ
ncbi:MAG: hypothetical protein ACLFVX_08605 [Archaeoglobaceae archaeon]